MTILDAQGKQIGTHTLWPQNLAYGLYSGTASWPTAQDATAPGWLSTHLPGGFNWTVPSVADFADLVSPVGSFTLAWTNPKQPNIATFLQSVGFTNILEYFWVSDVTQVNGQSVGNPSNLPLNLHRSFSMQGGGNHNECWSYLFPTLKNPPPPTGTNPGYCDPPHYCTADGVSVTVVAHLNETAGSWWAAPEPSS